jgi:glutathione S-transferase
MSLTLCGFAFSNYYSKVKLALLEKEVAFTEEYVFPSDDPAFRAASPRGKVPFIRVGDRSVCESQAIVEYLEDAYPAVPLYPQDPLDRAQCRSAIQIMELYVELVARRLYPAAFFGVPMPPGLKDQVAQELQAGIAALKRCVRFGPYIGGDRFGLADIAAVCHLPLVRATSRKVYGEDWLADLAGLDDYLKMASQRPHVAAVEQGRQQDMERFFAAVKKRYAMA